MISYPRSRVFDFAIGRSVRPSQSTLSQNNLSILTHPAQSTPLFRARCRRNLVSPHSCRHHTLVSPHSLLPALSSPHALISPNCRLPLTVVALAVSLPWALVASPPSRRPAPSSPCRARLPPSQRLSASRTFAAPLQHPDASLAQPLRF